MFLLPNKKHIDTNGVVEAMLDSDVSNIYFLDIKNGNICPIPMVEGVGTLESLRKQSNRYFEVPRASVFDKENWMKEFVEEMIPFEDVSFSEKLLDKLGDHFYENALEEITKSDDGWIHAWTQWSHDSVFGMIENWFATLPVEIIDEWEGCDDCAICKVMALDDDSKSLLLQAFSEQNFMNEVEEVLKSKRKVIS